MNLPNTQLERLRILFVTQEDPFYIPLFFERFFELCFSRDRRAGDAAGCKLDLAGVVIQRPLGNKTNKGLARRMYRLYGPVGFIRMGIRYTAARLGRFLWSIRLGPLRLWPRHRSVEALSLRYGVPILPFVDMNGEQAVEFVRREETDLVVSVSASQIFKAAILSAPRIGCINLHNAPLPHYRGMLPNFWQMLHGEEESVLTIHEMVVDLDKGDILKRKGTPIEPGDSLDDLIRRTKRRSAEILLETLEEVRRGTARLSPLPAEEGSYFTWPTREQAREFRRRGHRLL